MFQTVINGVEGIFDREHKTGRELLESTPGVHQRGRVGKEIETGHAVVPSLGRVGEPAGAGVESCSLRRGLDDPSRRILTQIAST